MLGARSDDPGALAYFEWSVDAADPESIPVATLSDPEAWARANPAMGIRISREHIENELRSMGPRVFAVERLGVGDWPDPDGAADRAIRIEAWDTCCDARSNPEGPLALAFDVTPSRSHGAIAVAGTRPDGLMHVEIVEHRSGTSWMADRLEGLLRRHDVRKVVCDAAGPAASLLADPSKRGIEVTPTSTRELAQACGSFFDAVESGSVRHLGTPELRLAVEGATRRALGDAWAWDRKNSNVDISVLVAATLALWAVANTSRAPEVYSLQKVLEEMQDAAPPEPTVGGDRRFIPLHEAPMPSRTPFSGRPNPESFGTPIIPGGGGQE